MRKLWNEVLNEGTVLEHTESTMHSGTKVDMYVVRYEDETYLITKNDGEIVYFYHITK